MTCTECHIQTCLLCNKRRHSPILCNILKKWEDKNGNSEEANERYLKLFTKPCPKCKTPIFKDGGCLYMKCTFNKCNYEFCFYCMSNKCLNHAFDKRQCTRFKETEADAKF